MYMLLISSFVFCFVHVAWRACVCVRFTVVQLHCVAVLLTIPTHAARVPSVQLYNSRITYTIGGKLRVVLCIVHVALLHYGTVTCDQDHLCRPDSHLPATDIGRAGARGAGAGTARAAQGAQRRGVRTGHGAVPPRAHLPVDQHHRTRRTR